MIASLQNQESAPYVHFCACLGSGNKTKIFTINFSILLFFAVVQSLKQSSSAGGGGGVAVMWLVEEGKEGEMM